MAHSRKFLHDNPIEVDEAGYTIENGVIVDDTELDRTSRDYTEFTRYYHQTATERQIEEAAWAARSGPCYIRRKEAPHEEAAQTRGRPRPTH